MFVRNSQYKGVPLLESCIFSPCISQWSMLGLRKLFRISCMFRHLRVVISSFYCTCHSDTYGTLHVHGDLIKLQQFIKIKLHKLVTARFRLDLLCSNKRQTNKTHRTKRYPAKRSPQKGTERKHTERKRTEIHLSENAPKYV